MIIKFDIYNEEFSFDKIESEEVVIDINDYVEEYDNIFKDRYRCVKAVGPINQVGEVFNVKDLFKGRFGMWIKRPDLYKGQNNEEKFEIINGWDCEIEQIKLKKGEFVVIWPDKADRIDITNRLKVKGRKEKNRIFTRLSLRFNEEEKIVIPAGRIVMYNITEFLRDAQMKLLGTQDGYANTSNRVIRGTTPKSHNGREDMVTIPRANYITTKRGYIAVMSERKPFINRWGQEVWSDEETYLDITKPIYGKTIQWIDPDIDPYGEEEWEDMTEALINNFPKLIKTDNVIKYENTKYFTDDDLKILNENFTGWVSIVPELSNYVMHVDRWRIPNTEFGLVFVYDGYFEDGIPHIMNNPSTYTLNPILNLEITKYNEKEPMIIKNEKDPYGEEDWEEYMDMKEAFETLEDDDILSLSSQVLVKDRYLCFGDFLRFDLLGLAKLKKLRIFFDDQIVVIEKTKNGKTNRIKGRVHRIRTFKIDDEQFYLIDMTTKKGEISVEIDSKYDRFKVKTSKKIKSPADPYGEEDWELVGDTPVQETKPPKAGKKADNKIKKVFRDDIEKSRKEEKLKNWMKARKASKPKFNPNELNY
jgi:hypothetical protein